MGHLNLNKNCRTLANLSLFFRLDRIIVSSLRTTSSQNSGPFSRYFFSKFDSFYPINFGYNRFFFANLTVWYPFFIKNLRTQSGLTSSTPSQLLARSRRVAEESERRLRLRIPPNRPDNLERSRFSFEGRSTIFLYLFVMQFLHPSNLSSL